MIRRPGKADIAQLMRFGIVGISATGLYVGSITLFQRLMQLSFSAAASVSFLIVVCVNYILHRSWTFRSDRPHSTAAPRFLATAVGGLIINSGVISLGTRWATVSQTTVLCIAVVMVIAWNYGLARCWVFVDRRLDTDAAKRGTAAKLST